MRFATRPARTSGRSRSHARKCCARCARRASASVNLQRPDTVDAAVALIGNGSVALGGGTDLVPLLRDGIVRADTLVELRHAVPRGIHEGRIGAGTTLAELEVDPEI